MGYSENPKTLDAIRGDLREIEAGKACQWNIAGMGITARGYAYKIREALYIASLYPSMYPELALNGPYFAIEVVNKTTVQARPKPGYQTEVSVLQPMGSGVAVQGLANQGSNPDEIMGKQTALSVVDAWVRIGPRNHKVRYPQASLEYGDLLKIHIWANQQTPRVLMFVTPEGGLTLKHRTADNEEAVAWSPEDE